MTIRTFGLALTAFLVTACAAAPATAVVQASNPESVASALRNAGYKVTLDKDGAGDPRVKTTMGELNVNIMFYDCTKNVACKSLQFTTGFDLDDKLALEKANEWSQNQRWGKVYIDDEGDPFMEYDLLPGAAGLSEANFIEVVKTYEQTLMRFAGYINF